MAKVSVYDMNGNAVSELELNDAVSTLCTRQ